MKAGERERERAHARAADIRLPAVWLLCAVFACVVCVYVVCVYVCVCVRERERVCVSVCMRESRRLRVSSGHFP